MSRRSMSLNTKMFQTRLFKTELVLSLPVLIDWTEELARHYC